MASLSIDALARKFVDALFLLARAEHRKLLSTPLLGFVILTSVSFAVLSLPIIQELIWRHAFTPSDRSVIIVEKEATKAWLDSISYILDIVVAILIGGAIFGERLATSFADAVKKYEVARENAVGETVSWVEAEVGESLATSVQAIQEIRQGGASALITHVPTLLKEARRLYDVTFDQVPSFYKKYVFFVLYSSFPGGLYGLFAFILFFASAGCKLASMYFGSPYLAP